MHIAEIIEACGFDAVGECSTSALMTRDEVRDMCAAGTCQKYGNSWARPPACGEIEHYQQLIDQHETCHIVQTWGQLEDSFDIETMLELEKTHKQRILELNRLVKSLYPDALVLAAGTCTLCPECTYPDMPCRAPELQLVSMEAAGLVVTEVCGAGGIPYNHGPNTMAYTSCVMI